MIKFTYSRLGEWNYIHLTQAEAQNLTYLIMD